MLRRALAIYMVLMTATGPGLCCCSFTHLFAGHVDQQTASPTLPPCCQSSSGGQPHGEGGCSHEKGDPQKQGCPCRQDESKSALVERAVEMPDQSQAGSSLLSFAFDGRLNADGVSTLSINPPPFLTSHDLLHLHQQLRC